MNKNTIDGKILHANTAITNAMNMPVISAALSEYGYPAPVLQSASEEVAAVMEKQSNQKKAYGEQFAATDDLNQARQALDETYVRQVKLSRVALKSNRGLLEALQLEGSRQEDLPGWLQQTRAFYNNALRSPEAVTELGKVGINKAALEEGAAAVVQIEQKLALQKIKMAAAQEATQIRDAALEKLMSWMSDFTAVARVALEDNPQMLEALGMRVSHGGGGGSSTEEEEPETEQ